MSARFNPILVIGSAHGIGEALPRQFHGLGKKVIATGREQIHVSHQRELTDLKKLQSEVKSVLSDYSQLDTVSINAGIQIHYNIFHTSLDRPVICVTPSLSGTVRRQDEHIPHQLSFGILPGGFLSDTLPQQSRSLPLYQDSARPVTLRKDMNVMEVVPPYIDTNLDGAHREQTDALQGGKDKAVPPMLLDDYIERFFTALEQMEADGSFKNEIGLGFGAKIV
ncbi:short chain dehydrogenase reductase [Hypoxylon sp. FL0890]|nr:short chain dehydrogenase reductase [Hypoxylon sp. FL0890]